MNILRKFTIKDLSLNKKRTIVTIIGIMLSSALICAVARNGNKFSKNTSRVCKKRIWGFSCISI